MYHKLIDMRTIKFRGKRVDNCDWVYGFPNVRALETMTDTPSEWMNIQTIERNDNGAVESISVREVSPKTVGQFTGLQDKNGVDIYEGDLDSDGNVVVWCDECGGWNFGHYEREVGVFIKCLNCEGYFMLRDHVPDFEITGNIHDK